MQSDEEHKRLRKHIQDLFRKIRELGNSDADDAATNILRRRRPTELNDINTMKEITEALEAVIADFSTTGGGSDENVRLITNKEKKNMYSCEAFERRQVTPRELASASGWPEKLNRHK